jgi:hypothetical protein
MDCTNCGACCLGQSIGVEAGLGDRIPPQFLDEHDCLKLVEGQCVFFDSSTRLCTNYEQRPYVCRRFIPGSARCLFIRLWADVVLDWFGDTKVVPSEAVLLAPFEVTVDGATLRVGHIPGAPERTVTAINHYNEKIEDAPCW